MRLKSKAGKKRSRPEAPRRGRDLLYYERKLRKVGCDVIIGVDEAGRGPLAGPVVAAAVKFDTLRFINRIDDSKKLTPGSREKAFLEIMNKSAFGIGIINEKIIDRINILQATARAMEQAVLSLLEKLKPLPQAGRIRILVDGNVKLDLGLPVTNIIGGDSKSISIAGASILAKVSRDRIMRLYDNIYPQYGFFRHKGYPTQSHRQALIRFGACAIHRLSFLGSF